MQTSRAARETELLRIATQYQGLYKKLLDTIVEEFRETKMGKSSDSAFANILHVALQSTKPEDIIIDMYQRAQRM